MSHVSAELILWTMINQERFPFGACLKHEMAKWRNGEMELKTRATVIKYELPSEIGSCFHLLPNLFCG